MTALHVIKPGLFTTVQDGGRVGFRAVGVPTSGVLDRAAYRLANALAGNGSDAAVFECIGLGPELEAVDNAVRFVFIGDAPDAAIGRADGSRVACPAGQSATLAPGDRLTIGALRDTFSLCLAIEGGIDLPPVLGSRSTYVRGGFGGFAGRTLRAGDRISVGTASERPERRLTTDWRLGTETPIRVVLGPQDDAFTPAGMAAFLQGPYTVTRNADRMGFRFEGPKIGHVSSADIVSDGAVMGSIQVPGSGQPIVLLADGQSVGGYTKIATVIGADLSRLVRCKPGDALRFAAVCSDDAESAAHDQERWLQAAIGGIEDFTDGLDLRALYERNLVSGVVDAS